jgi:glucokinase
MIIVLSVIIALLVATNATLFYFLLRQKPMQKRVDVTAQQLINDLTATGNALVRLERIAPSDVFLRSPKL